MIEKTEEKLPKALEIEFDIDFENLLEEVWREQEEKDWTRTEMQLEYLF